LDVIVKETGMLHKEFWGERRSQERFGKKVRERKSAESRFFILLGMREAIISSFSSVLLAVRQIRHTYGGRRAYHRKPRA
jgi:hypothetical protein